MSSEELICLPIAQIRLDSGTQVGAKIDEALVELRRSNADKTRAVQIVLADQEWSRKSTRWIAEV